MDFRDPNFVLAGSLSHNISEWKRLGTPSFILDWNIENGVNIFSMFKHFKGNFKGKSYNADQPVPSYFPNASNCKYHTQFIVKTLEERIENGLLTVLGRVGEVEPPILVMPITIEP